MTREQVHEMAVELKVSEQLEAEMQLAWMMRRDAYNERCEHVHECPDCGRMFVCHDALCVTDRAYIGEAKRCGSNDCIDDESAYV